MHQLSTLLKSLFPISVEIITSDDLKDFSIWAGELSASQTAQILNVDHFATVISGKAPDALYAATLMFNDGVSAKPIEGGYKIRFQSYDAESLNAFLEAVINA